MSASCIESTEDALQAHVSQQQRRPLSAGACNSTSKIQLPIWPSVANAHPPRGGTKDAISPTARRQASARADVRRCVSPSPHSSRESRWCTVVEISLARLAPFGVWGFSLLQSSEPPHFVAGGLDDGLARKRGDHLPRACYAGGGRGREAFNFSLNSCLACA
jgi:hypothetical protein